MSHQPPPPGAQPALLPIDLIAGLGEAQEDLLCTCLALFDDSTLQQRLGTLFRRWSTATPAGSAGSTAGAGAAAEATDTQALQGGIAVWKKSGLSLDALRVVLWMYLREAFQAPARTFGASRPAMLAAEEFIARVLHGLQPGEWKRRLQATKLLGETTAVPVSLDALARQTLEELLASVLKADDSGSIQARDAMLNSMRECVDRLGPAERRRLLDAAGADELNDAVLRRILLTGSGLGALSTGVGMAGFSAYILAAQASAFIPLVSGPALVSVLAVLSNPITVVAATVGMGWWATTSANDQIRAAIGLRVLSLLALSRLAVGSRGVRRMIGAFGTLSGLKPGNTGSLNANVLRAYQRDWAIVAPAMVLIPPAGERVLDVMERSARETGARERWRNPLSDRQARQDMAALSVLTVGDIAYSAFMLDPIVLKAADFAHIEELNDPLSFAGFAERIEAMSPRAALGAIGNLKGYVAERVVAAQLQSQGHLVEFPGTSNQAGWDLAVDGVKFQVKDVESLSALHEHFVKGYDYPVIANAELAGHLDPDHLPAWANQIHFIEGYNNDLVEHVTRESVAAGHDLLHPRVPVFSVVLSAVRQYRRIDRGEISSSQALEQVLLDGSVRAGLAVLGNYAGVGIGLLVFGPAGALVFGAALPVLSRTQSDRAKGLLEKAMRGDAYQQWESDAHQAIATLGRLAAKLLQDKIERLQKRRPPTGAGALGRYMGYRIDDEIAALREAGNRLQALLARRNNPVEETGTALLAWLGTSTLLPHHYQAELRAWAEIIRRRPSLADSVSDVVDDLRDVTSSFVQGFKARWRQRSVGRK